MKLSFVFFLATMAWGQLRLPQSAGSGSISGIVRDGERKPLAGVPVVVTPDPTQRGRVTPFQGTAVTKADGSYEITRVPAGVYWVCPQLPLSEYLSPCNWDVQAPMARVGTAGGSVTAKQDITMEKGSFLWVQVEDPDALLDKHRGGRADFRVGVRSPRGEHDLAAPPIAARGRKMYRMLVPKQGRFKPELVADFVLEHGPAGSRGASPFGVETQLAAGEQRVLIVNVRGVK